MFDTILCTILKAFGRYYVLGPLARHCCIGTLATCYPLLFSVLSHMALQRVCSTKGFIASWADVDRRCVCWISVSRAIPTIAGTIAYSSDVCSCSTHLRSGNRKTHTAAAFRPCGSSYVSLAKRQLRRLRASACLILNDSLLLKLLPQSWQLYGFSFVCERS